MKDVNETKKPSRQKAKLREQGLDRDCATSINYEVRVHFNLAKRKLQKIFSRFHEPSTELSYVDYNYPAESVYCKIVCNKCILHR